MNRFFNPFANAFTLCVHLMLCTALVFACSFVQTFFAEQPAAAAHTVAQGTVMTVAIAATAANEASDTVAFETNSEWTDDLAGDLPELMLSTGIPAASTATSYRLVGFKLGLLPHPFAERPQRPPQIVSPLV